MRLFAVRKCINIDGDIELASYFFVIIPIICNKLP